MSSLVIILVGTSLPCPAAACELVRWLESRSCHLWYKNHVGFYTPEGRRDAVKNIAQLRSHFWGPSGTTAHPNMPYARVGALPQPQHDTQPSQKGKMGKPQGITMEVSALVSWRVIFLALRYLRTFSTGSA